MTHEELYAEVRKDLIEISTKANMFMYRVRKKAKNIMLFPVATQRMTITTTRRNVWTLVGKYDSFMQGIGFQTYSPIIGTSSNDYVQMSGFKPRDMVMHYTAHFMQRYKEHYIDHYQIDCRNLCPDNEIYLMEHFTEYLWETVSKKGRTQLSLPQHFLYFFPLPQGQGSFLPTF